jgi:acyl carrier protein
MLGKETIAVSIERFIRNNFNIEEDTVGFSRSCDLFEEGFVDSIGLIKLISFFEREFEIHIEEEHLFDERFLSIDGESHLVSELMNQSIQ